MSGAVLAPGRRPTRGVQCGSQPVIAPNRLRSPAGSGTSVDEWLSEPHPQSDMGSVCRPGQSFSAGRLGRRCRWPEACCKRDRAEATASAAWQRIRGTESPPLCHSQRTDVGKKSQPPAQLTCVSEANPLLRGIFSACAGMECAVKNGLVSVYLAISDLDVVAAIRTGAHPGLVVNRCPLTAEVR